MRWILRIFSWLGLTCRRTTAALTEHAEGALSPRRRAAFAFHMAICVPCRAYRAQTEASVRALGALPREPLTEGETRDLARQFRARRGG